MCLFILIFPHSTLAIENLRFDNLTSINGLSNNTVYSIAQDSDGFIWIATGEGLNKFDGYTIKTFYHAPGDSTTIPSNFTRQLYSSSKGILLIGTTNGLCRFDKKHNLFIPLRHKNQSLGNIVRIIELTDNKIMVAAEQGLFSIDSNQKVTQLHTSYFQDICEYKPGVLWAASENKIFMLNYLGETIKKYENSELTKRGLNQSSSNIQCIYKDSRGIVWFGTVQNGLGYYKHETDEFISLRLKEGVNPVEDNFVRAINEDKNGFLWIGTESGLYIYNVAKQQFTFYGQTFDNSIKGLNDKAIYSIFRSSDDVMWIGTYFGGVNFTSPYQKGFYNIYADGGVNRLSGNALSSMIETSWGEIWIATEDGGITILNKKNGTFRYLKSKANDPASLPSNNVHALKEDKNGNIWIGTFIGGLSRYNRKTNSISRIKLEYPDPDIIQNVFSVFIDSKDRIWVGAISGLYVDSLQNGVFSLYKPGTFQDNFIYHIDEDTRGNIWICTYEQGIYRLNSKMEIANFTTENNSGLLSNYITCFFEDSQNNIWFGSYDGGLVKYLPETGLFKTNTTTDGLPNNTVYAITEDSTGNLWFSTNKGISALNPRTGEISNYTVNDGLIGNQFNFKSCLYGSQGYIYFGAVNGLTYFKPAELTLNNRRPVIHFTDFKVFNSSLAIGEKNILHSHVNFQNQIKLKYKYKVFTIEFVALNYLSPKTNEYAYYLEGLEKEWNYVGNRNSASYTNLSPGTYTFHVKAANGDGAWSAQNRSISIKILPPFWLSVWGYLLYLIVFSSAILFYIRYTIIRHREKLNMQFALLKNKQNEELSQHRLNFFTYISHEFKTPLTLILATLEHFMDYEGLPPRFKEYGNQIRKNAMRLLFLINQLMDFRKTETDHATLSLNKGEIIGFVRSTFDTFAPLMQKKQITGEFHSGFDSYIAYFDADKIEKILVNLIGNSVNSLENGGSIMVKAEIIEKKQLPNPDNTTESLADIVLTITDNGPGLSPEKLKRVFEPYYSDRPRNIYNSGIGLALVKSLVKFLNGHIDMASAPGKGTATTIQLPLIKNPSPESVKNEVFIENNNSISLENSIISLDNEPVFGDGETHDGSLKEYELLIVEDNKELATFLSHHFARIFKTRVACDGAEGLEKAFKYNPDIVISDIMMPKINGFELCDKLKESFETSHIPIILLTAKTGHETKLEGLHKGADAYLAKPFSLRELDLHVRNIIKGKENLKKYFSRFDPKNVSIGQLANKDMAFVETLTRVVFEHLDNSELSVDGLCKMVNISRTLIHLKLKKITGMSTTEFIKSIRLNEAIKLLQTGNYTVSEVAYKTGFNDPDYFRRSFKKLFNTAPSSVVNANRQGDRQ
ncbi:MAG: response regulator [Bacteroidales bacterium]|nr:response regulator [Bacteroidales bacterium]